MKKIGQVILLKNNYVEDDGLEEFLERTKETREKYPNLIPCKDKKSGKYFYKYSPEDVEAFISDLKSLKLSKEMVLINIGRRGYALQQDYILESLGFKLAGNSRIKVNKTVKKQADLFKILYAIDKECYIRLRNKSTGEYRAYDIKRLKDPYRLQAILKSNYFSNNNDMMYSLNAYNNMYKADEKSLFSLQNIAIDCDFNTELLNIEQAIQIVKSKCNVFIPTPNVMEFGHRLRLLYSIEDVPVTKRALKTYNKVAKAISKELTELNASPQSANTYARIEGSINSKNGAVIQSVICNPIVYRLRELQELYNMPISEEVKKFSRKGKNVINMPNYYGLNIARLRDLEKIQSIRTLDKCSDKEYKKYRELLCFLYRNYCLLCNQTHDEALENTINFNERFEIPMKTSRLITDTNNVRNKLYWYNTETILEQFDITPSEEVGLEMEKIVSKTESARRERIYQANKYNINRDDISTKNKLKYKEKLNSEGKVTKKEQLAELRAKIKSLRAEGLKNKDIAQELDLPMKTLERHITIMRKNGLL